MERDLKKSRQQEFKSLRSVVGKDDAFMQAHQIHKNREYHREVPEWIFNRTQTAAFFSKRFPSLNQGCLWETPPSLYQHCECKPCRHRSTAALWAFIIQHCFRLSETATDAAFYWNEGHVESLHIKPMTIRRVIQMIWFATDGKRLDGKPRSFGKPGRPKKSACTAETTLIRGKTLVEIRAEESRWLAAIMTV